MVKDRKPYLKERSVKLMRHLVLDTETTGLSEKDGHRIIEIGAVEMVNLSVTGRSLHLYINPERDIDVGAQDIHGLSSEFLADKPIFSDIVSEFTDFIKDDLLVIHNAPFDIGFLNAELSRCGHRPLSMERVIDTLPLAREKYPGAQASLDALCRRFGVDNSHRDLHGALIDADLLASVFVELKGGRQPGLKLEDGTENEPSNNKISGEDINLSGFVLRKRSVRPERIFPVSDIESAAHKDLLAKMNNPIWLR